MNPDQRPADVLLIVEKGGRTFPPVTWGMLLSTFRERMHRQVDFAMYDAQAAFEALTNPDKVCALSDGSTVRRKDPANPQPER